MLDLPDGTIIWTGRNDQRNWTSDPNSHEIYHLYIDKKEPRGSAPTDSHILLKSLGYIIKEDPQKGSGFSTIGIQYARGTKIVHPKARAAYEALMNIDNERAFAILPCLNEY
jgi:hypothetical protein